MSWFLKRNGAGDTRHASSGAREDLGAETGAKRLTPRESVVVEVSRGRTSRGTDGRTLLSVRKGCWDLGVGARDLPRVDGRTGRDVDPQE